MTENKNQNIELSIEPALGTRPSPAQHLLCYAPNRAYNMPYDNGSPPDDIAAAAGEVLTEIGAAPTENGGGTSATGFLDLS